MTAPRAPTLFAYRPLDTEIWARWAAGFEPAGAQALSVWATLSAAGLPAKDLRGLKRLWESLCEVPFDAVYRNYLCHPLRVAGALSTHPECMNPEMLTLALCHNFRELGANASVAAALEHIERRFLSDWARRGLDCLYTDRTRERDERYLAAYYDGIAEAGEGLMILKGLDKLDNHLSYAFEDIEAYHYDVVTRFVVPHLRPPAPRLAGYLERLAAYVRDPAVVERFRAAAAAKAAYGTT